MKKHFTLLTISILFAAFKITAQTFSPVGTTGYGIDAIAENTTALLTTNGTIDGSDYILYSAAYGQLVSPVGTGLPNNGTIVNGSKTYQLQAYTDPNVLYMLASQYDTLTFTYPQPFPAISLLCFATEGPGTLDLTVRFTDNTTLQFNNLTLDDWFATTTTPIINGFDRANRTAGTPNYNTTFPNMYSLDLTIPCASQNKAVQKIIFHNTNFNSRICVLAASAVIPSYGASASALAICSGTNVLINATGLSTYTWEPVGSFAGSNSTSISITPTVTTSYTLDGIVAATSCPGQTIVTIDVASGSPTLSLSGSTSSVCLGGTASITASGAYSYSLSNNVVNGGTFVPTATAVYTITGANGCGTSSVTTSISVAPLPISVSSSTSTVCAGSPATITAGGATTYTWNPGPSTNTNYITSPSANTTYTVVGQTGNCFGSNTISLNTLPLPNLTIATSNTSSCAGDQVNLSVNGNAISYTWSPGGQNGTSISDNPQQASMYGVSGTGSNGCISGTAQVILVHPNPVINITTSNSIVCSGGPSTLTASGASTYVWSTSDLTSTAVVNPATDMTYSVTGTATTGCNGIGMITVSVFQPTLGITSDVTNLCLGGSANITASGADTYAWSNGSNFQSITVNPTLPSVYTVTGSVTDPNSGISCDATTSLQVNVYPSPTISAVANHSIICQGEPAILTASGAGTSGTYTWTGGPTSVLNSSVTVSPIATQGYTVMATDNNGCKGKTSFLVTVRICTGIATIAANATDLIVYPNPSNGEFTISTDEAVDLMIINDLGQPVKYLKLTGLNDNKVVVSDLAAGVYFIQSLNSSTSVIKQKIMIVK